MKARVSITLSRELLNTLNSLSEEYHNRSFFLEITARAFIDELKRSEQAARDMEVINRRAEYLNEEVMDALSYQMTF